MNCSPRPKQHVPGQLTRSAPLHGECENAQPSRSIGLSLEADFGVAHQSKLYECKQHSLRSAAKAHQLLGAVVKMLIMTARSHGWIWSIGASRRVAISRWIETTNDDQTSCGAAVNKAQQCPRSAWRAVRHSTKPFVVQPKATPARGERPDRSMRSRWRRAE